MNVYRGTLDAITVNNKPLNPCFEIAQHSQELKWGYGGSGPTQLALAIMVYEYGTVLSRHPIHYLRLRWSILSKLPPKAFTLTSREIETWVSRQLAEDAGST